MTLDRRADRLRIAVRRLGPASADAAAQTPDVAMLDAAGGTIRRVTGLEQRAPGLFVADVALPAEAAARIEVRDAGHVARAADAARSGVRPETAMTAAMALPMAQVSAATGGWHRDDPVATPGPVQVAQGWTATDLWPWLALLALGLYLVEVAYRRWPTHGLAAVPQEIDDPPLVLSTAPAGAVPVDQPHLPAHRAGAAGDRRARRRKPCTRRPAVAQRRSRVGAGRDPRRRGRRPAARRVARLAGPRRGGGARVP
ncbi:hypothetical protein MOP88_12100 [Sphingomonas sp. WKB10]|nr:hypothetical protein [Sphingomonas sp. WKB10]